MSHMLMNASRANLWKSLMNYIRALVNALASSEELDLGWTVSLLVNGSGGSLSLRLSQNKFMKDVS